MQLFLQVQGKPRCRANTDQWSADIFGCINQYAATKVAIHGQNVHHFDILPWNSMIILL